MPSPTRLLLAVSLLFSAFAHAQHVQLLDVFPDKARYSPLEPVQIVVELSGQPGNGEILSASLSQLGKQIGSCQPIQLHADSAATENIHCTPPPQDFRGYLVSVRLNSSSGRSLDERQTAIDVSSDWKRFPRYGYLAHYNAPEGARPEQWIAELNRFHINGLEFYDFQYRHDQPLAGTVEDPALNWKDIAGRPVDGAIVRAFIDQAHHHNMMAMAYNASYSAYDNAFTRSIDPLPIQWAIWDAPNTPRTHATAKRLALEDAVGWSTQSLVYMNQNDPAWQHYLFGKMNDLFKVYPFDGWHVDTFGDKGGSAFDGSRVDFIAGFPSFINNASTALHKRIVFNAVGTRGQELIARSDAEFVYSELWEENETFAGILEAAEQVHVANPHDGFVIAAYVHRLENKKAPAPSSTQFNPPAVLLTDAAIFASGAAHIELGDGDRMLSSEYFPEDTRLSVSPALRNSLRHYYDFLTAYENYLRDEMTPADGVAIHIDGQPADSLAIPDTIWTVARHNANATVIHLINLRGSSDAHWRDVSITRPEPPLLHDLHLHIESPAAPMRAAGWASPDIDGGNYHPLAVHTTSTAHGQEVEITLPQLRYWDTVFLIP